ncbi:MAG: hypothetical protein QGF00_01970 [Planctomycetota bacterium]|jgi:hypothetical protein|nr:hypothetical protein [Planctomycetota bacterium]MDP7248343.1 hypothetical protein [Planctomycetota bacterium]
MRKSLAKLTLAALFVAPVAYIFAASDTSDVTVRVKSVDKLVVTDGGTITLDGTAGSNAMSGTDDTTAVLNYTHNKNANKKITAQATTSPAATGNDITLTVAVQDGAGAKTVYDDSGAAAAQDVVTGIAAGALGGKTVTYSANCTASGTKVAADQDFSFTITYTSVDE